MYTMVFDNSDTFFGSNFLFSHSQEYGDQSFSVMVLYISNQFTLPLANSELAKYRDRIAVWKDQCLLLLLRSVNVFSISQFFVSIGLVNPLK